MKPNRNNYASYNNYWYAMRTYRARLLGSTVIPPVDPEDPVDPELPDYRILVAEPNEPETGPLGSLAFASVYAEDGATPVRTANSIVFDPVEQKGYISATVNTLDLRAEGREINDAYYVLSVDSSVFAIEGFEPWHLDSTFFYSPVPIEDTASLDMDSLAMLGSTSGIYDEDKGGIVIYMKHILEEHPSETLYLIGVSMYGPEDGTTVIPPSPSTITASEYTLIDAPRVFRYQLPTAMSRTLTNTGELINPRTGSAEVTIPAATETSFAITALPTTRLLEDFGSSLAGEGPWAVEARIRVNWDNYILMPEGYSSGPDLVVPRLDRLGIEGNYVLPGLSSTSWLIPMWATEGIGSELMTDAIGTLYAPDPDDLPVSRSDDITSTLAELYRVSQPDTIASAEYPYTIPEEFPILLTSNYIYWAAPTNTEYDSLIYDANSFELEIIYRDARY